MATLRKGRQTGAFLVLTRMATLRNWRKIGAVGCERSLSLSLSLATVWHPLSKGERLVGCDVNAHSVSLMATLRQGRKIGVFCCERSQRLPHGAAQSLRRPPSFRDGGCTEPETVGNFHHGGAKSLKRPPSFSERKAQKVPKA